MINWNGDANSIKDIEINLEPIIIETQTVNREMVDNYFTFFIFNPELQPIYTKFKPKEAGCEENRSQEAGSEEGCEETSSQEGKGFT